MSIEGHNIAPSPREIALKISGHAVSMTTEGINTTGLVSGLEGKDFGTHARTGRMRMASIEPSQPTHTLHVKEAPLTHIATDVPAAAKEQPRRFLAAKV